MVRGLITLGLLIIALAVVGLIVTETEMGGDHGALLQKALIVGAVVCGAGLALGVLVRISNIRIGRRCPRCGRPVRRGHIYCEDHFQEAIHHARDQMTR